MSRNLELLKEVLSIPTCTYQEELMVSYIDNWLTENNIEHYIDEHLNVYAVKQTGEIPDNFYFPCVIAHTDTVHKLDTINVVEELLPNRAGRLRPALRAYNDKGKPTGIGGDDKCGIFACFELLLELPNLKAAFFVSEETGCHGSKHADPDFFRDVGYVIQFDAPENWMVTETCFGAQLFSRDSEFFEACDKVITEGMDNRGQYMVHPYTDVYALKTKFDFACINFSIGYYRYHSPNEYVIIEDTFNGIEMGKKMIEALGYKKHAYPKQKSKTFSYW